MADARRYFGGRVVKIVPPRFPSFSYGTIISRYSAFYVRQIHACTRERARAISRWDKKINRPRAATRASVSAARDTADTDAKVQSLSTSIHESRIRRAEWERDPSIIPSSSRSLPCRPAATRNSLFEAIADECLVTSLWNFEAF